MARIVYALSGQGRGHRSRALAIAATLRARGHDVAFCGGGAARRALTARGETVIPVPALAQVVRGNRVRPGATMRRNWRTVLRAPAIAERLADALRQHGPDLLVADFEPFAPRAAARLGVPVVALNHQQVVTETAYALPPSQRLARAVTGAVIRRMAPPKPARTLLPSFFFPPLRRPGRVALVPPIIRPAVQALAPTGGDEVLVYFNETDGAEAVLDALRRVDAVFVCYNFEPPARPDRYPNLRFEPPSTDGFLRDLARCRAVISTAGFTLISEALFLGKPLLAVPNRGLFEHEQWLNAYFLEREGFGEAVLSGALTARDVRTFLRRCPAYQPRLSAFDACGNEAAAAQIESILTPSSAPTLPLRTGLAA